MTKLNDLLAAHGVKADLARKLGISPQLLQRWIKRGYPGWRDAAVDKLHKKLVVVKFK